MLRFIQILAFAALTALMVTGGFSQSKTWPPTYPTPSTSTRKSYSDYYGSQLQSYHRPPTSARQYTYDRYVFNRPTVSPYLNLVRPQGLGVRVNNYYSYVRPEIQRREVAAATTAQRTPPSTQANNPYFNRLYSKP